MKVGIICAGDREFEPFIDHLQNKKVTKKAMLHFHEGTINDVEIVALYSGVCKVNAAIATQILIDVYGSDIIINAGTAGGMSSDLQICDTVISTEVAYHDVSPNILTEFHPWMESIYFQADKRLVELSKIAVEKCKPAGQIFWGRMVTGETFIEDEGRDSINKIFAPLTVDMETASIAHVCYVNQITFITIRTITDTADHSGTGHFEENCAKASGISKDITIALLNEMRG